MPIYESVRVMHQGKQQYRITIDKAIVHVPVHVIDVMASNPKFRAAIEMVIDDHAQGDLPKLLT